MVCPICITTAIVANAPVIAASFGGVAAIKMCVNRNKAPAPLPPVEQRVRLERPRTLMDPLKCIQYDEELL